MTGELLPAWPRVSKEVWLPLAKSASAPDDLFVVLVEALAEAPHAVPERPVPPAEAFDENGKIADPHWLSVMGQYERLAASVMDYRGRYETALNSEQNARQFFMWLGSGVSTEADAITFLESAHEALEAYGSPELTRRFEQLMNRFVRNFNLRYEIRDPFSFSATMPGVFSKMISEIRQIADADVHLRDLLRDFEAAYADLRAERSSGRMKTCLQKQFNLLEALGRKCPNVTEQTLGRICNQLDWPHDAVRDVGQRLYRFGSDYPGVRHAGTEANARRPLMMKDFISISLMLASFTPYVTHGLDSDRCYSA